MSFLESEGKPDGYLAGRKSPLALIKEEVGTTYGNFIQESILLAEYAQILKNPIEGVYVLPSPISPLMWYGVLFVRSGLYSGAIFKFTISIPINYPNGGCPRIDFQADVYHPLINLETGELETKSRFQRWRRDVNYIHELLSYASSIFLTIDTRNCLNREAANLYEDNKEVFKRKVKESIEICEQASLQVDPNDPHSIPISEWHKEVMRAARKHIFEPEFSGDEVVTTSGLPHGLSWVKKDTFKSFSKQDTN